MAGHMTGNMGNSRAVVIWLVVLIALALGTVLFFVAGGRQSTYTIGASAFSRSAIGYAGIADTMHRIGVRVVKSRGDSVAKLNPQGVLVVAEPGTGATPQLLSSLLNARTVLLILPKWTGVPSSTHAGWIDSVTDVPESTARQAAQVSGIEIVRIPAAPVWTHNEVGRVPMFSDNVQLIKSRRLRPVIGSDQGMLVGEQRSGARRLWVLADPDVIANYGLGTPANAEFAVALIDALRGEDGNVVFDEMVHGFIDAGTSPLAILFQFPFVLVTVQGAAAVALLLWATMRRFGAPVAPPPPLQAGKRSLIETTANLFANARHRPIILQRYIHEIVQDVGRQMHAPAGLGERPLVDWLRRVGRSRAVEADCGTILQRADDLVASGRGGGTGALAALARDIFRWKREVTDGVPGYSRLDRDDPERGRQGRRRAG
jgi:hypothetical protein